MAFADVARLVWSPGTAAAPADLPKQGIEEEDAAAPGGEWRDMLAAPAAAVSGPLPTDPPPAIVQETGRRPELDWNHEVNGEDVNDEDVNDEAARETSSGVSIQSASYSAPDSVRDGTSAGPALAHDANNLLSALQLYSELLGFGGVLNPEHRHYADDLKLLAHRSQELMERLLERGQAGGQGQAAAPSPAVSPGEPTPEVGEAAGLAAARPCQDETKIQERAQSIRRTSEPPRGPVTPADGWLQVETGCVAPPVPAEMAGGAQLAGETEARQSGGQRRHGPTQEAGATPAADTSAPGKPAPGEAAPGEATPGEAARTNLVDLLLRWGSLLSTLAHGALEVRFGPRAAAPIAVEAEAIERILVNLVRNAAAATRNGGSIRIGVGARGPDRPDLSQAAGGREVMVLTVDDSGDGMTAQQVDRALGRDEGPAPEEAAMQRLTLIAREHPHPKPRQEPAERFVSGYGSWPGCCLEEQTGETRTADAAVAAIRDFIDEIDEEVTANSSLQSARNSVPRHGLGLAIVRGLVRSSGGSLSIHSRPGLGTRIEIRWPTATAEASAIRQSDSELKRRSGSPSKGIGNEEKRTAERLLPNTAPGRNGAESGSTATQIGVGREGAIAC
jgi:signal transduction histidine kinase